MWSSVRRPPVRVSVTQSIRRHRLREHAAAPDVVVDVFSQQFAESLRSLSGYFFKCVEELFEFRSLLLCKRTSLVFLPQRNQPLPLCRRQVVDIKTPEPCPPEDGHRERPRGMISPSVNQCRIC